MALNMITCPCHSTELDICTPVLMRFICHCTICQQIYKTPYADVSVVFKKDIAKHAQANLEFKKYRRPPALERGFCISCFNPVFSYLKTYTSYDLAFIPSKNFKDQTALPKPILHMFYNRKVSQMNDQLPKYRGYVASQFGFTKHLLSKLLSI
ncbi:GFA family protein [Acinetobacter sp. AHP123]|uniref:GFA family protein n=1 Tax=Acinetobacter sp. AHP123 TaxID=2913495 RepID=UPI0020761BBC|nr:GFA family protein [Acinetobacter sp. AHP123]